MTTLVWVVLALLALRYVVLPGLTVMVEAFAHVAPEFRRAMREPDEPPPSNVIPFPTRAWRERRR